jgi:hypothetical protein
VKLSGEDRKMLRVLWIVVAGFLVGLSILTWAILVDVSA